MRQRGVFQVGVRFPVVQDAIHEVIHLVLEGVLSHIAAIGQDGWDGGPALLAGPSLGEDLVVSDGALVADELNVENVRLNALYRGCHFAQSAVIESHKGDAVGLVFIVQRVLRTVAQSLWPARAAGDVVVAGHQQAAPRSGRRHVPQPLGRIGNAG